MADKKSNGDKRNIVSSNFPNWKEGENVNIIFFETEMLKSNCAKLKQRKKKNIVFTFVNFHA
jgi:hypothetical protein